MLSCILCIFQTSISAYKVYSSYCDTQGLAYCMYTNINNFSGIVALCCFTLSFIFTEMSSCLLFVKIKDKDFIVQSTPGFHFHSKRTCMSVIFPLNTNSSSQQLLCWFYKSQLSPTFDMVALRPQTHTFFKINTDIWSYASACCSQRVC